jgi:ribonuclease HII
MTWIVGIDEAGYGPNLGPLVMTAAACRVPEKKGSSNLWKTLKAVVRRPDEEDDDRIVVGDSKEVYSTTRGLVDLETSVLAVLRPEFTPLARLLETLAPASLAGVGLEVWYKGTSELPVEADHAGCRAAAERFQEHSTRKKVEWAAFRSMVICPGQFNQLVERWGSKGAVLGHALADLLIETVKLGEDGEEICFTIDKHGGRNTYAALIQNALGGMVVVEKEGMNNSSYRVLGLPRQVRLTFMPRADGEHFCVALASMVSKYLREVLMLEFNRFWQTHIPELKPTAGYPGDAARYYDEIRATVVKLGIAEDAVWRKR